MYPPLFRCVLGTDWESQIRPPLGPGRSRTKRIFGTTRGQYIAVQKYLNKPHFGVNNKGSAKQDTGIHIIYIERADLNH
jgi:hypothetical protein